MPDYYEMPLSLQEYSEKMGNPTEEHHGSVGHREEGQEASASGRGNGSTERKGAH
jgi:hypothetical protein